MKYINTFLDNINQCNLLYVNTDDYIFIFF